MDLGCSTQGGTRWREFALGYSPSPRWGSYSYKPAHAARTHVRNGNFNPDFFLRLRESHGILVVEIKGEEDRDKNRSAAKFRDGKRHCATLNKKLAEAAEPRRYHFLFLSPNDFTKFFEEVANSSVKGWKSGLMQELGA